MDAQLAIILQFTMVLSVCLYSEVGQDQKTLQEYLSKGFGDTCMKCQSWIFLGEHSKPSLCCPSRDQITLYRQKKLSIRTNPEVKTDVQNKKPRQLEQGEAKGGNGNI